MIQKILSAAMAVLLCASLTVPAVAAKAKIRIRSSSITMTTGEIRPLLVVFTSAAEVEALTWSSSNDSVATVNSSGMVTAIASGTATVTAKTAGGLSDTCRVTVRDVGEKVDVRGVEMSVPTLTVRVNQTRTLWATPVPADASDKDVMWSSSDYNVAEVDGDGIVTGMAPGTAIITAEAADGRFATCEVTVPGKVVKGLTEDISNTESPSGGMLLTSAEMKTAVEKIARNTAKGKAGLAVFTGKATVPQAALNAAVFTAESFEREVRLEFITKDDKGKTQGWIIVDPQKAKDRTDDLKPGVYTDPVRTASVRKLFSKYFSNSIAVIQCAHTGNYGMEVQLAAKVDLSALDKNRLRFYSYDTSSNRYHRLEVASYTVDANGYLRLSTTVGGAIVITDADIAGK